MYALEVRQPSDMLTERLTGEVGDREGPVSGPALGETVTRETMPATARRHNWLRPGRSGRSEAREAETTKRQKPWKRALAGAVVGAAVLGTWAPANAYVPGTYYPESPFVNVTPIRTADLAAMRGGFVLPNGMNIDFGAMIETVRNGVTLLRTKVNFVDADSAEVETVRDGVTTLTSFSAGGGVETSAGSEDSTYVVHQINSANIGAIVNNVSSNTDILNTTQFNITISNFSEITKNLQAIQINRLSNIANSSILTGL